MHHSKFAPLCLAGTILMMAVQAFGKPPATTTASLPASQPASQPATRPVEVDQSSPAAVLQTLRKAAAGDRSAIVQCIAPHQRGAIARIMALDARLEAMQAPAIRAIRAKFLKGTAAFALSSDLFNKAMPSAPMPVIRMARPVTWSKAEINQDGDSATITVYFNEWKLRKAKGKWHVVAQVPPNLDDELKGADEEFKILEGFYQALTKGVLGGSITPRTWDIRTMRLLRQAYRNSKYPNSQ